MNVYALTKFNKKTNAFINLELYEDCIDAEKRKTELESKEPIVCAIGLHHIFTERELDPELRPSFAILGKQEKPTEAKE